MKTLQARLHSIEQLATGIQRFEFRPTDRATWPAVCAGAHVDLHLAPQLSRSYSLVNAPGESHRYVVAVQHNATGQGGSRYLHDTLRVGQELPISAPRNAFPLDESAAHSILIAGGIGITPLWSMAQRLVQLGRPWTLHYATRTPASAAFAEQLVALAANSLGKVTLYFDGGISDQGLDLQAIAQDSPADAHLYCCGPARMLQAFEEATAQLPPARVHREYFAAPPAPAQDAQGTDQAFTVRLSQSGQLVPVDSGTTILDALLNAGVDVPYSCMSGICGMCATRVLDGVPDHRDLVLSAAEKACGHQIILCCSRAKSQELTLDL
ncbi:PDR/VanB family oxidoreductase [Pantoea sp. 18069]|uniref:PDR/VanB family oxidoreductase n=1 Tax=Pantoea sp. 18069 TaxID=2681415 RepID=UPI001359F58D|nr:PDR/VanB family oxidoreductase [Pantoea sp. 18069]